MRGGGGWAAALRVLTGAGGGAALPLLVAVAAFVYRSRGCRGGSDTPWGGGLVEGGSSSRRWSR